MDCVFYFDFLSPYSYLAWKEFKKRDLSLGPENTGQWFYMPVILSQVIRAWETRGPAEIKPKREYLMRDFIRKAVLSGVPFRPPVRLPFNSLYCLRIALVECSQEQQRNVIDLFFRSIWEEQKDMDNVETVEKVLAENGHPARQWVEAVGDRSLREALKRNTKMAKEHGIFGLPAFEVVKSENEREVFWGHDSFNFLEKTLVGEDPLNQDMYEQMKNCYQEI